MAWGLDLGTALVPSDGSAVAGDAALHMTDWITSGDFSISGKFQHTYIYSNQALLSEEGVSSSTGAYLGTSTDTGFSVIIFIIAGTVYTSTYPIAQDEWVEFSLVLVGTTLTFTVNGNSNSVTLIVNPLTFNKWGVGSAYHNPSHHVLAGQWIFETNATQRIYDFDVSSHGLGQPVVTDTVGGLNATGQLFPEDGSSWIDFGGDTPDIYTLIQYNSYPIEGMVYYNSEGTLKVVVEAMINNVVVYSPLTYLRSDQYDISYPVFDVANASTSTNLDIQTTSVQQVNINTFDNANVQVNTSLGVVADKIIQVGTSTSDNASVTSVTSLSISSFTVTQIQQNISESASVNTITALGIETTGV